MVVAMLARRNAIVVALLVAAVVAQHLPIVRLQLLEWIE
jgi:hypothetical protein